MTHDWCESMLTYICVCVQVGVCAPVFKKRLFPSGSHHSRTSTLEALSSCLVDPSLSAAAMSHLEQLIVSMVDVFEEYAGQEGKKNQISMDELKTLIDNEVSKPEFQKKIHADDVTKAMDFLDKNHDGVVNFNEFSRCVATLARGYYKQKQGKGGKKGKGREEDEQEDQ